MVREEFPVLKTNKYADFPEELEFIHAEDMLTLYPDLPRRKRYRTTLVRAHIIRISRSYESRQVQWQKNQHGILTNHRRRIPEKQDYASAFAFGSPAHFTQKRNERSRAEP